MYLLQLFISGLTINFLCDAENKVKEPSEHNQLILLLATSFHHTSVIHTQKSQRRVINYVVKVVVFNKKKNSSCLHLSKIDQYMKYHSTQSTSI